MRFSFAFVFVPIVLLGCPTKNFKCPSGETFKVTSKWSWRSWSCRASVSSISSRMQSSCPRYAYEGSVSNWLNLREGCPIWLDAVANVNDFQQACSIADLCYSIPSRTKEECNDDFFDNMHQTCSLPGALMFLSHGATVGKCYTSAGIAVGVAALQDIDEDIRTRTELYHPRNFAMVATTSSANNAGTDGAVSVEFSYDAGETWIAKGNLFTSTTAGAVMGQAYHLEATPSDIRLVAESTDNWAFTRIELDGTVIVEDDSGLWLDMNCAGSKIDIRRLDGEVTSSCPTVNSFSADTIMVSHGEGFCDSGFFAGWDGLGVSSQEDCNYVCNSEPECTYAAWWSGQTCSRYNEADCDLSSDFTYVTYRKEDADRRRSELGTNIVARLQQAEDIEV